jgi:hypothetical protein
VRIYQGQIEMSYEKSGETLRGNGKEVSRQSSVRKAAGWKY